MGTHPHLRRIQEGDATHDSNSSSCHAASLLRNDISCLPRPIARLLQTPSIPLSPCNCIAPCTGYPIDSNPPCRNALNRTECTMDNCISHACTNRLRRSMHTSCRSYESPLQHPESLATLFTTRHLWPRIPSSEMYTAKSSPDPYLPPGNTSLVALSS